MALEQDINFFCPYCGGENSITISCAEGTRQEFISDCLVCCRPFVIRLKFEGTTLITFDVIREND